MEVFKITKDHKGQTFIVRPLLSNARSYKIWFSIPRMKWEYRYICLAFINDELKIFNFNNRTYNTFLQNNLNDLRNDKAFKIIVDVKKVGEDVYINNFEEIISDDKYRYDNTEEKRQALTDLLSPIDLDSEFDIALKELKDSYRDIEIEFPNTSDYKTTNKIKLGEIYDKESQY